MTRSGSRVLSRLCWTPAIVVATGFASLLLIHKSSSRRWLHHVVVVVVVGPRKNISIDYKRLLRSRAPSDGKLWNNSFLCNNRHFSLSLPFFSSKLFLSVIDASTARGGPAGKQKHSAMMDYCWPLRTGEICLFILFMEKKINEADMIRSTQPAHNWRLFESIRFFFFPAGFRLYLLTRIKSLCDVDGWIKNHLRGRERSFAFTHASDWEREIKKFQPETFHLHQIEIGPDVK